MIDTKQEAIHLLKELDDLPKDEWQDFTEEFFTELAQAVIDEWVDERFIKLEQDSSLMDDFLTRIFGV